MVPKKETKVLNFLWESDLPACIYPLPN